MKYFHHNKQIVLTWGWLLLISALTTLKVAPANLHADVLMYSIMPLQNLTLYYWGQNRLLNVLPLATIWIRDPVLNLMATMALAAAVFYGLLYIIARAAALLTGAGDRSALILTIFVTSSFGFIISFIPAAIFAMAIAHIEYPLSALLVVFATLKLAQWSGGVKEWSSLLLPGCAIVLAIGINPAALITIFFVAIAVAIYKREIRFNEIALIAISGIAFIVWNFVASRFDSVSEYGTFRFEILFAGIVPALRDIAWQFNLPELIFLFVVACALKIGFARRKTGASPSARLTIRYLNYAVILFCVGWLVLFASNRWVEINQFSWRYFTYIIFALIFLCAVYVADFAKDLTARQSTALTSVAALLTILFLIPSSAGFDLNRYEVFKRANMFISTKLDGHLYSGDYWLVWPLVFRDLAHGYESYGLASRGEGNREGVRGYVEREISENGYANVYCLNAAIQECVSAIRNLVGIFKFRSAHSGEVGGVIEILEIQSGFSSLKLDGDELSYLPSQVGALGVSGMSTRSRAGHLVYGPYTYLEAGRYHLNVTGRADHLVEAYVDVAHEGGAKILARFDLAGGDGNLLVKDGEVNLPSNVTDLEVRIWVGASDDIELYGYSLEPVDSGSDKSGSDNR